MRRKSVVKTTLFLGLLAVVSCQGDPADIIPGPDGSDRFINNRDGTLQDLETGLVWQQADSGTGMNWTDAKVHCENLTLAGRNDWRLPDRNQLQSIVSPEWVPTIDPVFATTQTAHYWTSVENQDTCAWTVSFLDGRVSNGFFRTEVFLVRCVSGPG